MRKSVHPEKKHQSFGVSFPPHLRHAARKRAYHLEVNLSRYLQHLVEADLGIAPLPATFEAKRRSTRQADRATPPARPSDTHHRGDQIVSRLTPTSTALMPLPDIRVRDGITFEWLDDPVDAESDAGVPGCRARCFAALVNEKLGPIAATRPTALRRTRNSLSPPHGGLTRTQPKPHKP